MVCFWRHSSLWQFSFLDRTEHRNCGFSLTLRVNSNFLLNKQLFSSLKIRRFMVSWTKIPHPRKKSGKYTGLKSASVGQQKIRGISVWGAHSLSDQHSVKSCFWRHSSFWQFSFW
jgi:hypothetical protein